VPYTPIEIKCKADASLYTAVSQSVKGRYLRVGLRKGQSHDKRPIRITDQCRRLNTEKTLIRLSFASDSGPETEIVSMMRLPGAPNGQRQSNARQLQRTVPLLWANAPPLKGPNGTAGRCRVLQLLSKI